MTDSLSLARRFFLLFLMIAAFHISLPMSWAAGDEVAAAFEVRAFELSGNSIFSAEKLQEAVKTFTGKGKTAADVEKAVDRLHFHLVEKKAAQLAALSRTPPLMV